MTTNTNIIQGDHYRFTVLTTQLIRIEYSETGQFTDAPTQTVLNRNFDIPAFDCIETADKLEIITPFIHLTYKKDGIFTASNLFAYVRYNYSIYGNRWYYGDHIETLKGTARTLDEMNGATPLEEGILAKNGLAILDDSSSFLLGDDNVPYPRPAKQTDLYLFGYGREYLTALKDFYTLTGHTPLLPRYTLGNWWSRYWKYDEAEYLNLMDKFEKSQIPLSVSVVDMDWHLTDVPERFGSGWTGYTWNNDLFPDPKGFINKLHDKGLKVTLNVHPAEGIRAFEAGYDKIADRLGLNKTIEEPAKFDIGDATFRAGYFEDIHHPLEADGVDFWWIDWQQGSESGTSGIDPLWLLNHYHYLDITRDDKAGIILSRYAGVGSHRYPIGFSGDSIITWDSLDFQPYFTATASNIGYTWWSHDIGGHMNGYKDEELSLRWLQFGIFSPINRLHSSSSAFTGKEPWRYNAIIASKMAELLRLRHALIPYLYTMNSLTHTDGLPLVQPMYYQYPLEEQAYHVPNQYFFGSELFVMPITTKADASLKHGFADVWLPSGTPWYDFFTGARYKGGTNLRIARPLDKMAVFAKAGAIVPLDAQPLQTKSDELPMQLHWHMFPGADNTFTLIEHDANDSKKEAKTTMTLDWNNKKVTLTVDDAHGIIPKGRTHKLLLKGTETNSVQELIIEANAMPISIAEVAFTAHQDVSTLLFERLDIAEMSYPLKDTLLRELGTCDDVLSFTSRLGQLSNQLLADLLFEVAYLKFS